jgi:DNA-binding MarR family transcriptional regulator
MFDERICETMNKKQELLDRIEKLTPEQFELLIALYSQQEQEFVQDALTEHQTFLRPCV